MLKDMTTIILGAGSSFDLGFPMGPALLKSIDSEAKQFVARKSDAFLNVVRKLGAFGPDYGPALEAANQIIGGAGTTKSIDAYLYRMKHSTTLAKLAKLCIAKEIIEAEIQAAKLVEQAWSEVPFLCNKKTKTGYWALDLITYVTRTVTRENVDEELPNALNRLSVVTFNYDRSFEYFVTEFTARAFHLDHDRAFDLVRKHLRLAHVYGSVDAGSRFGSLMQQFGEEDNTVSRIMAGANSLRTIHESQSDSTALAKAKGLIGISPVLIFIGNSYIEENFRLLECVGNQKKRYLGTCVGLSNHAAEAARHLVSQCFGGARIEFSQEWTADRLISDVLVTL